MKIVLATGIYPPEIGGPATYSYELAKDLKVQGHEVEVVTYAAQSGESVRESEWPVHSVARSGGTPVRWLRYARALRRCAQDADIVYAFSSISCGMPLRFAGLRNPKKILRLGGDFFWERYTDRGGRKGLRDWYNSQTFVARCTLHVMHGLLRQFDHIVFSTAFQQSIYEDMYSRLPEHSVIENAVPDSQTKVHHEMHTPFRILFVGRLVRFKNLTALLSALVQIPQATMTIVGSGPEKEQLWMQAKNLSVTNRSLFVSAMRHDDIQNLYEQHDLLVLPSLTEISPNTALEARAAGLPVLLTRETGLSSELSQGMVLHDLQTPEQIVQGIQEVQSAYEHIADDAVHAAYERSWNTICIEHVSLFESLL